LTRNFRRPQRWLGAGAEAAVNGSDKQALGQGEQVESPVEPVGKAARVTGGIIGAAKRMVGPTQPGRRRGE